MFDDRYQVALDWEHSKLMDEAMDRLSKITKLRNEMVAFEESYLKELVWIMAQNAGKISETMSFKNKIIKLLNVDPSVKDLYENYSKAESTRKQLDLKWKFFQENVWNLKSKTKFEPR